MAKQHTHTQQQQPTRNCHLEVCASCEDGRGAREVNVSQARSHFGDAPIRLIVQAPEAAAERHTKNPHPSHIECGSEQETKEACWLANTRIRTHTRAHTHTYAHAYARTHAHTHTPCSVQVTRIARLAKALEEAACLVQLVCEGLAEGGLPAANREQHITRPHSLRMSATKNANRLCVRAHTRTLTHAFTLGCLGGLFAHALASSGSPSHGHPLRRHQTQEK